MSKPILLKSAAELLEIILTGKYPAGSQMERYFRAHPNMGVRDRGFVAETVYGCLRQRRILEHIAGETSARTLVAAHLLTQGYSARALEDTGFQGNAQELAERVRNLDQNSLPFEIRSNLPDWLADRLRAQLGDVEALALAEALNRSAPLDLRVNTLKATREETQARLAQEGFSCTPTPYSPSGLRHLERASLLKTQCFQQGLFEVQDEGSQLLSLLLEPKRHEMIVDFCAGAGGKALHLGTLMANTGTVYAFDISPKRLDKLKPRIERAKLDNVRAVAIDNERDARVQRFNGKIDRVLVDAPCSGSGTLRRSPDIKWRELDLAEFTDAQKRILTAAAALVKPGGRLVYATCSLLREENDDIVADFLSAHAEFQLLPAAEILGRRHVSLPPPGASEGIGENPSYPLALRLYPHRHHTDGFYAVALHRKEKI